MREHIVINSDRSVTVPDSLKKIGIQYDHNVNTLTFDCPRYADDAQSIDMSKMQIFINWMLPDKSIGCSIAENIIIDEADSTLMHFDWIITSAVTPVFGILERTLVCIKQTDTDGREIYHWNTDLFQKFSVGEGMECNEQLAEENMDVITQLLVKMDAVDTRTSTEAMRSYVSEYMTENPPQPSDEQANAGVDAYMTENGQDYVNTYMGENVQSAVNTYMDVNAQSKVNTYMEENAQEHMDTYMEQNAQNKVDDYLERNPLQLDNTLTDPTKAAPADKVGEIGTEVDELKGDLVNGNVATHITMPTNLYNKNAATIGGYISDGGVITEHEQFSYSDFIEIDKTKKYAIWTVFGINYVGAFYDKNKQFIGLFYKTSISNGVIDFSSFSPLSFYNSIYFVRLNQTLGDMDGSMFIEDATSYPSDYIPYEKPKYEVVGNLSKAINELLESYGLEKGYILINETLSNIAIGKNAMKNATTDNGAFNVAIGDNAMMNNTGTGSDDTGNYNVAVGYKAMEKNTTGNHNTAVGFQAMPVNTTGTGNTAIGEDACLSNTIGNGNTGIGRYSLFSNQEGGDNTAIGIHSLRANIGQRNTAIGASAGRSNKGNNNIFIGYYSNSASDVSNSICLGQENYCFESNSMDIGSVYIEKVILTTKYGKKLISFNSDGTVTWSEYTQPSN